LNLLLFRRASVSPLTAGTSRSSGRPLRHLIAVSLSLAIVIPASAQRQAVWDGSDGNWSDPERWSSAFFPNNGNDGVLWDATVRSGSVSLDQPIELDTFRFEGGELTGIHDLTVDTLNWTSGDLSGSGTTAINSGGSLAIDDETYGQTTLARTLINNGEGTFTMDQGALSFNGGRFVNHGTFDIKANGSGGVVFDAILRVTESLVKNTGTFIKSSEGSATIDSIFENSGTWDLRRGRLALTSGGTHTGHFDLPAGSTLHLGTRNRSPGGRSPIVVRSEHSAEAPASTAYTHSFASSASLTGGGTVVIDGGATVESGATYDVATTVVEDGGGVAFNADAVTNELILNGESLRGKGSLITNIFTWTDGSIGSTSFDSTLTVRSEGVLNIMDGDAVLHKPLHGTLANDGDGVFSGGAAVLMSGGAKFINNGTFTVQDNGNHGRVFRGINGLIVNNGIFIKSTSVLTHIGAPFDNSGTLEVRRGQLSISRFMQTNGTTQLAGGNLLQGFSGPFDFQGGRLEGSGTILGSAKMSGTLTPGTSVGTITVTDSLSYGPSARTIIDIGGRTPSDTFDLVKIEDDVTLDGDLSLRWLNGFEDQASNGDTFEILSSGSLSGQFANVAPGERLGVANSAKSFVVNYGPGSEFAETSVVLSDLAALLGDINGNGDVNNLDINPFVLALTDEQRFIDEFGYAPSEVGDINGDGEFNNLDINGFVNLLTSGSSVRAVPEPGSIALLTFGGLSLLRRRRCAA